MKWRSLLFASLLVFAFFPGNGKAAIRHVSLRVNDISIQLPYAPREAKDDQLVDVCSLQGILPISVEKRGGERVIRYGTHQLEVQPGRVAALLDGKWLVLKRAPVAAADALLVPNRQLFDLLRVSYVMQDGQLVLTGQSELVTQLQKEVRKVEGNQVTIGLIGVLQPHRWIVALQTVTDDQAKGYGNLYEAVRETGGNGVPRWKLIRLRTISDTAGLVYLEWMPNGSVFENIVSDKRSEFLFVETCGCAGGYQYGTMFTVTEMGLVPVWHSQATYERIQKTPKGWVLVTHRKDAIPTRTSTTMPYWEIHEMWSGQSFRIIKQEYVDPLATRP